MQVIDKRQERVTYKMDDLTIGKVYEDEDGDIMIWTHEKKMTTLACPDGCAAVGHHFAPNSEDRFTPIEVSLNIH